MPIYMDIHNVPGVEAQDVAEAHRKDLLIQDAHNCKCITYWIDEARGNAFCLIDAPSEKVVEEIHRKAHGLVPNKVIEVSNELVQSFLGRIYDPEAVTFSDNGLKVFSDSAFRILLVTDSIDPVLLQHNYGKDKTAVLLNTISRTIKKELAANSGSLVEHGGSGFIGSFTSATNAINCALNIQKNLSDTDKNTAGLKIVLNAGEPVEKSNRIFGDTIQLARQLSTISSNNKVVVGTTVKALIAPDSIKREHPYFLTMHPEDETVTSLICDKLERAWQDTDFTVAEFCTAMTMSKSQLYRKTKTIWGLSPNELLNEYRLNKARLLLKSQRFNIAETTFDCGFSSPSYFTKCFKNKFGLLPASYLNLLQ